jgi:hypothetical protein
VLFESPDGRVLRIDRVGAVRTYAARLDGGPWSPLGALRSVIVIATGAQPETPWIEAIAEQVERTEAALPDFA